MRSFGIYPAGILLIYIFHKGRKRTTTPSFSKSLGHYSTVSPIYRSGHTDDRHVKKQIYQDRS
jgi:hypothetical protein